MCNTKIRDAVRAALGMGAVATLGVGPNAFAQEQDEEPVELGRIVTTGSRISRLDLETARPITVISRDDIERSGQPTVADVLRNTTQNSFGEYREVSGSDFAGQALVGLKGLGSTRTLVLLNGRRMPRSPVTGNQAIDLATIPLEAVERIEILSDSASAIYGSDAIGGVINVILRKDYEGAQVMGTVASPSQNGADETGGSILIGGTGAKSSFVVAAEVYNKDIIFSRDRPFTATDRGDGVNIGTTEGISPFGNTLINFIGPWRADPNCDNVLDQNGNQLFSGVYNDGADQFCTFAYADVSAETQKIKRQSLFLNADYEIAPGYTVAYTGTASRVEAFGRYAPAVGGFFIDIDTNPNVPAAWQDLAGTDLIGPFDALLGHRFVGLGPRDDTNTNFFFDNQLALNGTTGMFDWELVVGHTQYDGKEIGRNYVKDSTTVQLVSDGVYNPFDPLNPSNEAAYAQMRHTTGRDIEADFTRMSGSVNFDAGELPSGPLGWAFGFDYFDEHFRDSYDAGREGMDVIGSAGNSRQGARSNYGLFAEALIPVTDNFELSAALRYDSYNDSAGTETSPYLAGRYRVNERVLVRASWGQGFRAANMNNLYSARSFSAEPGSDIVRCRDQGTPLDMCGQRQFDSFSGGNAQLEPEQSESFNVGVALGFDQWNMALDYWNVEITEGIQIPTVQDLINLEFDGRALPVGSSILRFPAGPGETVGAIRQIDRPWLNLSQLDYSGVDMRVEYRVDSELGEFNFGVTHSHILEAIEQTSPTDPAEDLAGDQDKPEFRTVFVAQWSRGDHTVTWTSRYIDGYLNSGDQSVDSNWLNDLQYSYNLTGNTELAVGVDNLADEDPPLDPFNDTSQPFNSELYDMDGRVPYVTLRYKF